MGRFLDGPALNFGINIKTLCAPLLLAFALTACGPVPNTTAIVDPHEKGNRAVHQLNKSLDSALLKPASKGYAFAVPDFAKRGVTNFSSNLSLPGMMLNDLLQLNLPDFFSNTLRFTVNSTLGIGGLMDVAGQNSELQERHTNFGETLHVWGIPEGNYVELPLFGPSTARDAVGLVVDFAADPVNYIIPANQRYISTASYLLNKLGDRDQYSDLVESVLYESDDSYAQARLLYLQSRRHALYGEINENDLEDPYAE